MNAAISGDNIQHCARRYANSVVLTDEDQHIFIAGHFQRLHDALANGGFQGEGFKNNGPVEIHVFQVFTQGQHGSISNLCQPRFAIVADDSDSTTSEDMLTTQQGVIDQIVDADGRVMNQKAFEHAYLPVTGKIWVIESEEAALSLARQLKNEHEN